MKIQVTKQDIETGNCKIPQKCMIAMAIKHADPTVSYVAVRTNGITITKRACDGGGGVRQHWTVPLKAARAIIKFDSGEEVKPFSFIPKMVDETVIKPVDPRSANADKAKSKKRRSARKAEGLPQEPKYGRARRVAGI
jgi:hypothetical protein